MPVLQVASPPRSRDLAALALSLAVVAVVAVVGGLVTAGAVDGWYRTLEKPVFNPPDWLFGPVWTALYVMMAVAAWLVWRRGRAVARPALLLYAGQLALNLAWTLLFFGAHAIAVAFIEILVLLAMIVLTARAFFRVDVRAGWLMVPYALWVAFAAVLTGSVMALN